jgi:hypothetical protein
MDDTLIQNAEDVVEDDERGGDAAPARSTMTIGTPGR